MLSSSQRVCTQAEDWVFPDHCLHPPLATPSKPVPTEVSGILPKWPPSRAWGLTVSGYYCNPGPGQLWPFRNHLGWQAQFFLVQGHPKAGAGSPVGLAGQVVRGKHRCWGRPVPIQPPQLPKTSTLTSLLRARIPTFRSVSHSEMTPGCSRTSALWVNRLWEDSLVEVGSTGVGRPPMWTHTGGYCETHGCGNGGGDTSPVSHLPARP